MTNEDIKKILNDLYALDPALRSHEKELITIIRTLGAKPKSHIDATFAADLRSRLLAELAQKNINKQPTFATMFTKNLRYAFAGAAALAVAVIAIGVSFKPHAGPVALLSQNVTITKVGGHAFGSLSTLSAGNSAANTDSAQTSNASAPQAASAQSTGATGVTNGTMMPAAIAAPTTGGGAGKTSAIAMPIRPPGYEYGWKYIYTGSPINQNQAQLNVLKKITSPINADQATTALTQAGFGQVDLSSFGNLSLSNATIMQNQSYGYTFYIDFQGGTISINQNYAEWPQNNMQDNIAPLTIKDIPSDSDVIAIANQFLQDHHIPTANYGNPTVTSMPYAIPMMAADAPAATSGNIKTNMPMIPYYPETKEVLYPLQVNGMNVYSQSGSLIGLTVDVNVRYRRVANVYNLDSQNYQSSAYDAITDSKTILDAAESTQMYPIIYNEVNMGANIKAPNVTTYDLGTPSMAYVQMYQSDISGNGSEFLVPAYIFPVTPTSSAPSQNIVVPLIKDFLQKNNPSGIVPYGVTGSTGSSGGSAGSSGGGVATPTTVPPVPTN